MNVVINIVVSVIFAMVAWAFLKSAFGAIFFGLVLAVLIHWYQNRT